MSGLERRYRRLLRWYPTAWRARHGEVLLGTLLDAADAEGRDRPAFSEAWSMRLTGLGERLTLRAAVAFAVLGLLAGAAALALVMGLAGSAGLAAAQALPVVLGGGICPALVTAGVLCLLRKSDVIAPARAMAVLALACGGWALNAAATWSWSVGFDEADAGDPRSAFAASFGGLFVSAWTVGALAIWVLLAAIGTDLSPAARWVMAGGIGIVVAPVLGIMTVNATLPTFAAAIVVVLSAVMFARSEARPGEPRTGRARAGGTVPRPPLHRTTWPAACGLATALLGIAFAFSGSILLPSLDGTQAMRIGLGVGSLAFVPLVLSAGRVIATTRPDARITSLTGVLLTCVGLGMHTWMSVTDAAASSTPPWAVLLPLAIGVGVMVSGLVPDRGGLRVLVGASIALAVVLPMWGLLSAAPFVALVAAAVMLVSTRRIRRRRARLQPQIR